MSSSISNHSFFTIVRNLEVMETINLLIPPLPVT